VSKKRRTRKPPRSLSEAEIAEIDALADRHWRDVQERQALDDPFYAPSDLGVQFILARVRDVGTDNFGRVLDGAVNDLLGTSIPLSPVIRHLIKGDRQTARDPKRREHGDDAALAFAVENHVRFIAELLRDAGYTDAQTRAAKHAAAHWRKIARQDGRARFTSGRALTMWLRRHRGITENTPKM
jgi:hypothetical protein